ncbi:MAG: hypothetical protein AAF926_07060, partial [Pseudomonadota bacterium]
IHRRWREISQDRSKAARPAPAASSPPASSEETPNRPTSAPQTPQMETDPAGPSAGLDQLKARMNGGLFSQLDRWVAGSNPQTRPGELHPLALAVMLLLLAGLTRLVLRRATIRDQADP